MHSCAHLVDTSKNGDSCAGYTGNREAVEGPPDASMLHKVLTSVVQINR